MRACVKPANGKVEIVDIPTPEPGPGEMIVKTSMATVCGSDMHFLDEFPNEMLGALFVGSVLPQGLLMGHEGVGTVHAVGEGVSRFREGDRVMASCLVGCGKCRECMTVDHSVCTGGGRVLFGCQAEYYKVPFADVNAAIVPDGVSDELAILATYILSTGSGAIERGHAGDLRIMHESHPARRCSIIRRRLRAGATVDHADVHGPLVFAPQSRDDSLPVRKRAHGEPARPHRECRGRPASPLYSPDDT